MATAFAITGIQRSRLKHYRPSYSSPLPPIYEDSASRKPPILDKYKCVIHTDDDYMYVPNLDRTGKPGTGQGGPVHDYEQIDALKLSQVNSSAPVALEKQPRSMIHGIMSNRAKNKTLDTYVSDVVDKEDKHGADGPITDIAALRRASSLYQGFSPTKKESSVIKTNVESSAEDMTTNGASSNKWRKLEPDPLKLPFWCPAENKIKKRCFAVCFVILVLVIGTFVVVSLDGWIFKAKGHGISGRDKTMVWGMPPPMFEENMTDISQTNPDPL